LEAESVAGVGFIERCHDGYGSPQADSLPLTEAFAPWEWWLSGRPVQRPFGPWLTLVQ